MLRLTKTSVALLTLSLCLTSLALATPALAHETTGQERNVNGYTVIFTTDPGEPVVGKATTLQFSVLCNDNKAHIGGSVALEVSKGETSEIQKTESLGSGQETLKVTKTFDSTGSRNVNFAFTPKSNDPCASATGTTPLGVTFSFNVGEESFLPAPTPILVLAGLAATALLLRTKREC